MKNAEDLRRGDAARQESSAERQRRTDVVDAGVSVLSASPSLRLSVSAPPRARGLNRTEWRRRAYHMAPGLLPFALWFVPHADPLSPTLQGIIIALAVVFALAIFVGYRRIARAEDRGRLGCVAGYAGSVLATLLIFPAHAEIGLTVLAILAFGDGSATLGGMLIGGPRLPWNSAKTLSGLLCFLLVGGVMASIVYWGEVFFNPESDTPPVTVGIALLCGFAAAGVSAIAESLPVRLNDNVRVGVTAAVTVAMAHALVVGC